MIGYNWLGGIIGDVCGSIYEWHNAEKKEDIDLFKKGVRVTDDSVLTCAVASWLLKAICVKSEEQKKDILIDELKKFAQAHPYAGYGSTFRKWAMSEDREATNSFGNGAGMRVSACGFFADTLEEAMDLAKKSAEVTHNHPEGIKGAQAIASAIFMAASGMDKVEMKEIISKNFEYDLDRKVDDLHNSHPFNASCQVTVPEALIAFFEGGSFEDVFKKAIWIGGDSDTIADMACAIAGAYYGIPSWIQNKVLTLLPEDMSDIAVKFAECE